MINELNYSLTQMYFRLLDELLFFKESKLSFSITAKNQSIII